MDALDCVSTTFCVAVDTSGDAVIYNGTSWGTPSDIDSTRSVDAVSCTSSTFCVAVGASGYAAIYTGSWAASSDVDSTRTMDAVACVSTSFCVTGDTTGYSAKYTGSWATATDIDGSRSISSIACTSTTFCVTGDTTGYSAKYTGSWATATDIDGSRSIKQVVCVSSTFCLAIDGSGYSAIYTGSWATATDIDGSTALESLTCVSSSYCVASDASGDVLTYSGSWGSSTNVDGSRSVSSISCPTTTFCAAVDSSGYAVTFAPVVAPATVSQLNWDTNGSLALVLGDSGYYYLYGPGSSPVEQISLATSIPTYLTYSPSNSTWLTTNEAGDETAFYGYDAFGNLAFGTSSSAFGYAGQYKDAASGFSNLRNRYYDPATGQFVSVDPMVSETNQPYAYAGDDPVNGVDPMGLHDCGWLDPLGCVGNAVDDVGNFVVHHPLQTFVIIVGIAAAATGVGALAEAGLAAGAEAGLSTTAVVSEEAATEAEDAVSLTQTLSRVSVTLGATGSLADLPKCIDNPSLAGCLGVVLGFASAGLGFAGILSPAESFLQGILSTKALGFGLAGLVWDVFGNPALAEASGNPTSGKASACR
jgi:RHS repeat-associated protein